jgi:hypothetical protein
MSAPDVSYPSNPGQSALASAVVGNSPPTMPNPQSPGSPMEQQTDADESGPSSGGGSRLLGILKAVAGVASNGLAGIPDKGRPSFVTGVGEGTRSAQAAQKQAQDIKFKTFDDQVRAAQLHNQDLAMQAHTQEQQDAHEDHMTKMHAGDADWGIKYDSVSNDGEAVMDHMRTQTAANGSVSVPAGTHVSGDGKTILIPQQTPETDAGQLSQYKAVGPALGFTLQAPSGATKLDPKVANAFYNKLQGFDANGNIYNATKLPALIASNQSQRSDLAKRGAPQAQLDALDGIVAKQKAQLKADNDANDLAANKTLQRQKDLEAAKASDKEEVNAAKPQKAVDTTELNAVAYDPNYQNPDGSKGGNVVMSKADASAKGLQHYKADPSKLNSLVAGFNDVQNKLNMLADVANDPKRMGSVQPGVAAAMLAHGKGIEVGAFGTHADTSRINEALYAEDVKSANQATRDYVTAMVGAHEAVTQLPRLQTFGQSSRMTQQQMEAAVNLLPHPGDGAMAQQKMVALQGMLDPLRKQVPHMPGAESIPSWLEKQQQQKQPAPPSNLGKAVARSPIDFVNSLQTR